VCPEQHHLAVSVSRSIESYADANFLDNGVDFFQQFPWQRLLDAIASSIFESVIYTEIGELLATVGYFKGQVQCFSMQVVINKCFLLNPEKTLAQIRLVVLDKNAINALPIRRLEG